ncbi:hypothetical protein L2E82_44049 [Cichorium intybus]|uniref:Uncharacterized protein n=1 Tax=Cichorium intybus TaxID=13427 RepID=A0ACB8ZU33_CICIN|nr:hypothetical protein L2E82_44049 [Cichorium intybus]
MQALGTQDGEDYKALRDKLVYYKTATTVIMEVNSKIVRDTATIMELLVEAVNFLRCSIQKVEEPKITSSTIYFNTSSDEDNASTITAKENEEHGDHLEAIQLQAEEDAKKRL